jgi:hypothetical protein
MTKNIWELGAVKLRQVQSSGLIIESAKGYILKSALQFLNNRRRGFLLVLSEGHEAAAIEPGYRVFRVYENAYGQKRIISSKNIKPQ